MSISISRGPFATSFLLPIRNSILRRARNNSGAGNSVSPSPAQCLFSLCLASTAYDTAPADHLGSAGGFSDARVDREHVPARMHSPPLRLDGSDPNSAESYSKVFDTGLQE